MGSATRKHHADTMQDYQLQTPNNDRDARSESLRS
jgi:hypothetical protein